MNSLQTYVARGTGTVQGIFRLRRPRWRRSRNGNRFIEMELEDMSGKMPTYLWKTEGVGEGLLKELACVDIAGTLRRRRAGLALDLLRMQAVRSAQGEVVRLIPQSLCPIPWLLFYLDASVAHLTQPILREFVLKVLATDGLAFPFVSAPASLNHHHNYPGGLLQHSLECVQNVSQSGKFSELQKQMGIVAALFHDIGKILTLTSDMRRTTLGRTMDHDKLALEVLAPHLLWLDERWPEGGAQIRYLLTWRKGRWDDMVPRWPVAEALQRADRKSAGMVVGKR